MILGPPNERLKSLTGPHDGMNKETRLVAAMANASVALGLKPPVYPKPRWYQFGLKRRLAYYDKHGWPYRLEG